MRPSSSAGGRPVQSPTWARKSPVGTTALAVKRMCWLIIAAWWSRQRPRYSTSSSSESASGSTDCSSRCFAIAFGLYVSSHSRELLAPELARHHLGRPLEALRDLLLRRGQLGQVAEAVDVRHREAAHRHPVEAREVGRAARERRRMDLRPVARQRPRKVNGILLVRPGARRLEREIARLLCAGHGAPLGRVTKQRAAAAG